MLLDVINVVVEDNYVLLLTFENGEVRKLDMQQLINVTPYNRLKESGHFTCAKIEYGTVVWHNIHRIRVNGKRKKRGINATND